MKRILWHGIGALLAGVYPTWPAHAQSLTGVWQGVETDTGEPKYWPAVLRLQKGKGAGLFGVLYQEVGGQPGVSVTFQVQATGTASGLELLHGEKLNETGRKPLSYWCEGAIIFTYDAQLERLIGRAAYRPVGDCSVGTFTLYRIKLKSPATVTKGTTSTVRVSGRNVQWFADPALQQPLATGNTYRVKLRKTTTFYLKQGYYPTAQSPVVPITVRVKDVAPPILPPPAAPEARDTAAPAAPAPLVAPTPVVLPTLLFQLGTPELLPETTSVLDQLAAELKAQPSVRLRVLGHTDRLGEPDKNQVLSEQRAAAVKAYLVRAGVAADRITALGYGDSRPLYPSPDARNRRVEVQGVQ